MKYKFWCKYIEQSVIFLLVLFFISTAIYGMPTTQKLTLECNGQVYLYDHRPVVLKINGNTISTGIMPPVILEGRTLVPAREVFESLGATVEWIEKTKEIIILSEEHFITLQIDNKVAIVGDEQHMMDVESKLIHYKEGNITKTMIPFRFVAEVLGYQVDWDQENYIIDAIPKEPVDTQEPEDPSNVDHPKDSDPSNDLEKPKENQEDQDSDGFLDQDYLNKPMKASFIWEKEEREEEWLVSPQPIIREEYAEVNIHSVQCVDITEEKSIVQIMATGPITYFEHHIWENKLVVDIDNSNMALSHLDQIAKNHSLIKSISASQYSVDPKKTRVVFELLNTQTKYQIMLSPNRQNIEIQFFPNSIQSVSMNTMEEQDIIQIEGTWGPEVEILRLTNPDRLVIDIPYTINPFGGNEERTLGQYVEGVRTSQYTSNTTRLVLDVKGQPDYKIQRQGEQKIQIVLTEPTYQNIEYVNGAFIGVKLKKDPHDSLPMDQILHEDQYNMKKYILTLPGDYTSWYGVGEMKVNDGVLGNIQIQNNSQAQTQLIFTQKSIRAYKIKEDERYIYIYICNPKEVYQQIVVIDPGHGGKDPGAGANGLKEKTLNLDISKRLWQYLNQDPTIKVYMTRMDDTYPTLQERCILANDVEADLFISIHNNSTGNTIAKGTEVLYFPDSTPHQSGLTGKQLAQILYQPLTNQLGMYPRGVIPRTDLYVLKHTTMPAVILEIGFMTNSEDAAKLKTESFQEMAAQAIYEGIQNVLKQYPTER
ncbi:MAG: AMIN domain-containing protein [Epulopiscium sp.]|nr:AMIN domain-containing protein [Candidatus Epulonipiscium sp.]